MPARHGVVDLVTVREAAELASRTPETVRRWVWSGRLEARRDGNRLLLVRADVERLLRGGAEDHAAKARSLAEWAAAMARSTAGEGVPGGSGADLVLADRADRERGRASR